MLRCQRVIVRAMLLVRFRAVNTYSYLRPASSNSFLKVTLEEAARSGPEERDKVWRGQRAREVSPRSRLPDNAGRTLALIPQQSVPHLFLQSAVFPA